MTLCKSTVFHVLLRFLTLLQETQAPKKNDLITCQSSHQSLIASTVQSVRCAVKANSDVLGYNATFFQNTCLLLSEAFCLGLCFYKFQVHSIGFTTVLKWKQPVKGKPRGRGHDYSKTGYIKILFTTAYSYLFASSKC